MIVDCHTRALPSSEALGPQAAAAARRLSLPAAQDRQSDADALSAVLEPVDAALVLGFQSDLLDVHLTLDTVLAACANNPKALPVAGIDPTAGGGATTAAERAARAKERGAVAITTSPGACGCNPTSSAMMALLEACQNLKLPVLFESGARMGRQTRMRFDRPELLDEVLWELPELRVVISGMGDPWIDQTLLLLERHPHCFADLAGLIHRPWRLHSVLLDALHSGAIGQILLASGFPNGTPEDAIKSVYKLSSMTLGTQLPTLPREPLSALIERDTLSLLGIPQPASESAN